MLRFSKSPRFSESRRMSPLLLLIEILKPSRGEGVSLFLGSSIVVTWFFAWVILLWPSTYCNFVMRKCSLKKMGKNLSTGQICWNMKIQFEWLERPHISNFQIRMLSVFIKVTYWSLVYLCWQFMVALYWWLQLFGNHPVTIKGLYMFDSWMDHIIWRDYSSSSKANSKTWLLWVVLFAECTIFVCNNIYI